MRRERKVNFIFDSFGPQLTDHIKMQVHTYYLYRGNEYTAKNLNVV